MHVNQVHFLTGGRENISIDANCSWQPVGLTPPTKALGPVPPRSAPVIEMEIHGECFRGEEISHLTASLSVCLFTLPLLWYYHFLST